MSYMMPMAGTARRKAPPLSLGQTGVVPVMPQEPSAFERFLRGLGVGLTAATQPAYGMPGQYPLPGQPGYVPPVLPQPSFLDQYGLLLAVGAGALILWKMKKKA